MAKIHWHFVSNIVLQTVLIPYFSDIYDSVNWPNFVTENDIHMGLENGINDLKILLKLKKRLVRYHKRVYGNRSNQYFNPFICLVRSLRHNEKKCVHYNFFLLFVHRKIRILSQQLETCHFT